MRTKQRDLRTGRVGLNSTSQHDLKFVLFKENRIFCHLLYKTLEECVTARRKEVNLVKQI